MTEKPCFLCGTECEYNGFPCFEGGDYHCPFYRCPHCGRYVIGGGVNLIQDSISQQDRFRMACVVHEYRIRGEDGCFGIFNDDFSPGDETIERHLATWWRLSELQQEFPANEEVFDRALMNLSKLVEYPAQSVEKPWEEWSYILFCPKRDIMQQVKSMEDMGFLSDRGSTRGGGLISVAAGGWSRLRELGQGGGSGPTPTSATTSPTGEAISTPGSKQTENASMGQNGESREVFVVHGHDNALRSEVCRLLERLDLTAVVLSEKPNRGRVLMEKFEQHSNVAYAVVLLTPDDEGRLANTEELKPRARQNVVFELGFFCGKLGRQRVCALVKDDVEFPSDIQGFVYMKADDDGAWRLGLAREIKDAGLDIDLNRLG